MGILLSPTEFILWEGIWKKALKQLLRIAPRGWMGTSMDHLAGKGDFTK